MNGVRPERPMLEGGMRLKGLFKKSQVDKPLVTIVTATYNDALDLLRTVRSVRALNYGNIEWIIADGGSTDDTVDVIRDNEDIVDFWKSEPDSGIYDAWNKGVLQARGDWIGFLGAGDRYHADAIDLYMKSAASEPSNLNLISSKVRHVNNDDKTLRVWGSLFDKSDFRMLISHCGALHHKSLFEKHGLFDISYSSASDYEFLMRCREDLNPAFVDAITADMLVGGISTKYVGLFETYRIRRKHGEGLSALLWLGTACAKRFVRPLVRGY